MLMYLTFWQIDETRAACDAINSPVVFSHNDMLSGNILIVERSPDHQGGGTEKASTSMVGVDERRIGGTMQFIDDEYSAAGYR